LAAPSVIIPEKERQRGTCRSAMGDFSRYLEDRTDLKSEKIK
jgi:hypothetical protein